MNARPAAPDAGAAPLAPAPLAAAACGIAAALGAATADPLCALGAWAALAAHALRPRAAAFRRNLPPRLASLLAGAWLVVLPVDALLTGPVRALVRLVLLLLVLETLGPGAARGTRVLLFGLLLLMSAAAETTELWFLLCFVGWCSFAAWARLGDELAADAPAGAETPRVAWSAVAPLVVSAVVLGSALFFVIPRLGSGWAGRATGGERAATLETGVGEEVRLDAVGPVKKRGLVAFRARVRAGRLDGDPDSIYWRAAHYTRWTGGGWVATVDSRPREIVLREGQEAVAPGATGALGRGVTVEIERARGHAAALAAPGRALKVRVTHGTGVVRYEDDGTLAASRGIVPRAYEVSVPATGSGAGTGAGPVPPPDDGTSAAPEPALRAWAQAIAPPDAGPEALAAAFVADLGTRRYSLDTSAIDPSAPLASFLGGAPGHCEYFASAMALGLRVRGVPARVVSGWLGAEAPLLGERLVVRESRAHLWVEAWLPDRGWTRFDPTPPAGRFLTLGRWHGLRTTFDRVSGAWDTWILGLSVDDQAEMLHGAQAALAVAGTRALAVARAARAHAPALLLALLASCLACAAWFAWRRRARARTPLAGGVPETFRALVRLAERRGLAPAAHETALEFAERAGPALGDVAAVRLLAELYERERFGGARPLPADRVRAARALERLAQNV